MKWGLIVIMIVATISGLSQGTPTKNYLMVRLDQQYDNANWRPYYIMYSDVCCDSANEIYTLIKYDNRKKAVNTDGIFYNHYNEDSTNLYNYFLSPAEMLYYLTKKGWVLFSIYSETSSGNENLNNGKGESVPVTTVSSRPVYYFIK